MDTWLKIAVWGGVGLVIFWVVLQIVSAILGFISWLIGMLLTLVIVGILLVGAYYVLSRLLGGGGSTGTSRGGERDRIYE